MEKRISAKLNENFRKFSVLTKKKKEFIILRTGKTTRKIVLFHRTEQDRRLRLLALFSVKIADENFKIVKLAKE